MADSVILKFCRCHRPFDIITGQALRMDETRWMPLAWKDRCSTQPCNICDHEFYTQREIKRLEDRERNGEHKGE